MSGIFFGIFKCVGKSHTLNKRGKTKFKVNFEDDQENKLTILVDETTFEAFQNDDPLPWKMVKHQRTLDEVP